MSAPAWGSPAAIYAIDHRVAELCRDMQITGFGFDAERAAEFDAVLAGAEGAARMRLNEAVGRRVKALSLPDLMRAFFDKRADGGLGAPVFFRSALTKRPSLGVDAMRGYTTLGGAIEEAALAVLEVRRVRKVRATYVIGALVLAAEGDGRIHPSWLNYGAVSGRWSCQGPNLANLPRKENDPTTPLGGIRSLYVAPPDHVLVSFDCKQLEMRMAAYASGDPVMIQACEAQDMHAANAAVIFGDAFTNADPAHRDTLRQIAKSAGFAVCYMAGADTVFTRIVASGVSVTMPAVERMLARLQRGFKVYYAWQDARLHDAIRTGFTDEPVTGRKRWLGHDPSPTECANHPIQGGAAGMLNTRLPALCEELEAATGARLVASVYDSGTFEVRASEADLTKEIIVRRMQAPLLVRSTGIEASFPVDIKIGERWS